MKIAIINNMQHQYMGGVEKYTQLLIQLCNKNGWEAHEFSVIVPNSGRVMDGKLPNVIQHDISNGAKNYPFHANKEIKKIIDSDKFDVIIGNSLTNSRTNKSKKYIHVQHMHNEFYTYKSAFRWYSVCNALFLGLGSVKSPIKLNNVVFYTPEHFEKKVKNPAFIPLPLDPTFGWREKPKKGEAITWIARHEEPHKGLKNLNTVFKLSNNRSRFIIGGDGKDTKKIKIPSSNMVGKLSPNDVKKYMDNSSVFIMTSNFEGFGFTVVEALSRGVPVVLYDTFRAARFFDKCDGVFLIKKGDHKEFANKIDEISNMDPREWRKLSDKCISFSKEKFDIKKFDETWTNYIKTI